MVNKETETDRGLKPTRYDSSKTEAASSSAQQTDDGCICQPTSSPNDLNREKSFVKSREKSPELKKEPSKSLSGREKSFNKSATEAKKSGSSPLRNKSKSGTVQRNGSVSPPRNREENAQNKGKEVKNENAEGHKDKSKIRVVSPKRDKSTGRPTSPDKSKLTGRKYLFKDATTNVSTTKMKDTATGSNTVSKLQEVDSKSKEKTHLAGAVAAGGAAVAAATLPNEQEDLLLTEDYRLDPVANTIPETNLNHLNRNPEIEERFTVYTTDTATSQMDKEGPSIPTDYFEHARITAQQKKDSWAGSSKTLF